jgi:hypothetical protein
MEGEVMWTFPLFFQMNGDSTWSHAENFKTGTESLSPPFTLKRFHDGKTG